MLIDFSFVLVMCLAVYLGLKKGLIRAVISFFAYLIAMILAVQFSSVLATHIHGSGSIQRWIPLLCFLGIFIVVILLGRLLARLLEKSTEMVMLGWLNKLGGVVIYAFTYTILFSAILFFGTAMNWFESRQLEESFFVQFLSDLAPNLMETLGSIIPPLKNSFSNLEEFFRAYKG